MKTNFKTFTIEQRREKQIEYEAKHGVKFDAYETGFGMAVVPVITRATKSICHPEIALALVTAMQKSTPWHEVSFYKLSDQFPITDILETAKFLQEAHPYTYHFIVTRMGNAGAIAITRK